MAGKTDLENDVEIGEHCSIHNAIMDKHASIPANTKIGYNKAEDKKRFHVIELKNGQWLTVIKKNRRLKMRLPKMTEPKY